MFHSQSVLSFFFLALLLLDLLQVECLVCHNFAYPGEEVSCSVRGCQGVYHRKCVKDRFGISLKKFKCQQHVRSYKNNPNIIFICAMLF